MNLFSQNRPDATAAGSPRLGALALVIVASAVSFIAANASASATLPVSPTFLSASAADNGLQIEPATITYTGDGTGIIGGANVRHPNSAIHWAKWTSAVALGTGFNQLNNCNPSCAGGTFRGYAVKIELWRPRTLGGTLVFTRMTIFYNTSHPPGNPPHYYTFTDTYTAGTYSGYGWGPPSEQGYCVNTYGQKPAPGCKSIQSLP
jgi:hypothetical protein